MSQQEPPSLFKSPVLLACFPKWMTDWKLLEGKDHSADFLDSLCVCAKLLQSCLTFCDPMDCSLPGYPVHGILQARILEWVAVPSSRIFPSQGLNLHLLRLLHWQAGSLPWAPTFLLLYFWERWVRTTLQEVLNFRIRDSNFIQGL